MESSLSLEETNKIRISLGLKPLVDDGAPVDTKEKEAADNFSARKEHEEAEKRRNEIAARIEKNRNKRELHRRLVGATLGDADDNDDTLKWVKKSRKREKELVAKRVREMDDLDNMYQQEYTEKDLAGLKVSHDFEDLKEGEDRILTLKDSRILDNEEDELQNIDIVEREKDEKRNTLKTKRRDYTGYDDDEFTSAPGMKRAVLSKYDEEIEGSAEARFRLGGPVSTSESKTETEVEAKPSVNRSLLSIDYLKNVESSDYVQEGDTGFKKPKKKKQRSTRRAPTADVSSEFTVAASDDKDVKMEETDAKSAIPNMDANFIDDDDLQAVLAQSRRRKVMKARRIAPEEIAQQVVASRTEDEDQQNGEPQNLGTLTLDDTSEFVRSINIAPAEARAKQEPIVVKIDTSHMREPSEGEEEEGEAVAEFEGASGKDELMDYEEETDAILQAIEQSIAHQGPVSAKEDERVEEIGTSGEQTFSRGMAATLNILRQQGVLATTSGEVREREKTQRDKDQWLAQHRQTLAWREVERLRSKGQAKDQATREYENRLREQQEARQSLEFFKDYKPDVEIKYHDEFGRELTPKEAWKALSHKFHGKGSGRMKTEKRLKKIAEEKKRDAMGSGDTPLSMNAAFQVRQARAGQAHMVLSVGNRGAVPQAAEFLDATASLSKKDRDKGKGRKRESVQASPAPIVDMTGFTAATLPGAGPLVDHNVPPSASVSALPTSISSSPAPMTKSGFTRVMGEATPASGSASPGAHEERGKVQFGFGFQTKRKADGEPNGVPFAKR